MAKATRRPRKATGAPRKRRGAKLLIDEPLQITGGYSPSLNDEAVRERCLQYATGLNTGKEMKLADLIDQAKEIYNFIKFSAPAYVDFGVANLAPKSMPDEEAAWKKADQVGSILTTFPETDPSTHRSKFEETHAL